MVQNIKRDPFEQAVGDNQKTTTSVGGSVAAATTAFQYDWNVLPIGQRLWLQHPETFRQFPPLQAFEGDCELGDIARRMDRRGSFLEFVCAPDHPITISTWPAKKTAFCWVTPCRVERCTAGAQ